MCSLSGQSLHIEAAYGNICCVHLRSVDGLVRRLVLPGGVMSLRLVSVMTLVCGCVAASAGELRVVNESGSDVSVSGLVSGVVPSGGDVSWSYSGRGSAVVGSSSVACGGGDVVAVVTDGGVRVIALGEDVRVYWPYYWAGVLVALAAWGVSWQLRMTRFLASDREI